MSFLTDEQAAYLAQLYTGTDAPKLHKAPTMYVHDLEQRYADRGYTIQRLERLVHESKEQVEDLNHKLFEAMCSRNRADNEKMAADVARVHAELKSLRRGITIHKLERKLHKANRKYKTLHRAMHEDTKKISVALCKSFDRFFALLARDSAPVEWPRFEDGEPVLIGNWIAAEMGPFKVGSILFCDGHVLIYDEQHFHYVKLRDGEFAEHDPYGRR